MVGYDGPEVNVGTGLEQATMQITVKFFAMVRERLGVRETEFELPEGSRVADVQARVDAMAPELAPLFARSMVMRNQEYADPNDLLADGDEIACSPPVSGGDHYRVHDGELDAEGVAQLVADPGAGAIVTFVGVVRDNARG